MARSERTLGVEEIEDAALPSVEPGRVLDDTAPAPEDTSPLGALSPEDRRRRTLTGIVAIVVGIVTIAIAIGYLPSVPGQVRVVVGLAGLVVTAWGVDRLCKARFGLRFPTSLWAAGAWMVLVLLGAVFADLLPLAESTDPSKTFHEPILARPDLFSRHPLGTDRQALDILGGILHGLRVSLIVGVGAVTIGLVLGGTIGILAGYYRAALDLAVDIVTTAMLAFPPLILLMGIAAVLPRNIRNVTLALAIISIPTYVRLARANTFVAAQREFVLAARVLGAKTRRIIIKDIVPSVIVPLMSYAFVVVAVVIVAEASLSFLGLSIPRPEPTLGNMIAAGQDSFQENPHLVFLPATALFLTVLALNRLGEEARKRFDPREAKI